MTSPFQIMGLASGLDTSSMISQLMAIEQRPLDLLKSQKAKNDARGSVVSSLTTQLTNLESKFFALTLRGNLSGKTVSSDAASGSTPIASATATADAASGTFKVWVDQLATSTTVQGSATVGQAVSANVALASAGFGLTPTTGTFSVNGTAVTIDSSTVLSDGVDAGGSNTIIAKLNAISGITATLVNDSDGRLNKLRITSTGSLQLGSGADTSNFLTAAKLLTAQISGGVATSTGNLGVTQTTAALTNARFQTALTSGAGSFKVNGVTINYNTTTDSLNNVIGRINASAAGVTATYDSVTDKLKLTANGTGSTTIALEDVSGNLLAASGLLSATQTLGVNALYRIDSVAGGAQQSSASNQITGVIAGVTLSLKNQSASPVTFTIGQDSSSTVSAVRDMVSAYNSTMSYLRQQVSYDPKTKVGGLFSADPTIRSIETRLKTMLTSQADGLTGTYTKLADLGISFGAPGSAIGQTTDLTLDESKLTAALIDNPYAVRAVFSALSSTATLQGGGSGSVASISGSATSPHVSGTYTITTNANGTISAVFTPTGGSAGTAVNGVITAGGTNSTLIAGLTITAAGTLVDGTNTIAVTMDQKGVAYKADDFLKDLISTNGLMTSRKASLSSQSDAMAKRIADMQRRLAAREASLNSQFSRLEQTMSRLKSQGDSLAVQLTKINEQ